MELYRGESARKTRRMAVGRVRASELSGQACRRKFGLLSAGVLPAVGSARCAVPVRKHLHAESLPVACRMHRAANGDLARASRRRARAPTGSGFSGLCL
ncbi:MAG: hypothetical protein KatS3mg077_1215 [Candidatus Binatia bacterium]|nr:MAG: hypothetical protein KatS3mg077_1215 [Candidatus Binatia bacterium]